MKIQLKLVQHFLSLENTFGKGVARAWPGHDQIIMKVYLKPLQRYKASMGKIFLKLVLQFLGLEIFFGKGVARAWPDQNENIT